MVGAVDGLHRVGEHFCERVDELFFFEVFHGLETIGEEPWRHIHLVDHETHEHILVR